MKRVQRNGKNERPQHNGCKRREDSGANPENAKRQDQSQHGLCEIVSHKTACSFLLVRHGVLLIVLILVLNGVVGSLNKKTLMTMFQTQIEAD